jgi:cytosine/adenosine deaminase-related metal-dependent hydrolase
LMLQGTGFFADLHKRFGSSWLSPHTSTIRYFHDLGVLRAGPLFAHCVTVSEEDIDLLVESGSGIAHCPKSNAKFGHGYAPFEQFLDKGVTVGLGSDSVASNNACDMLEEGRFAALVARNRPGSERFVTARETLRAVTLGGAKAMGLGDRIGTLEPGKQADIIAISLADVAQQPVHDVETTLVFASNARDVRMTMVAGEEIYRDGISTRVDETEIKAKLREMATRMK